MLGALLDVFPLKYNAQGMYTTSVSIAIVWWLAPLIGVKSHVVALNDTNGPVSIATLLILLHLPYILHFVLELTS